MATVVGIAGRHALRIEASHRNQPNKNKLVLYKPITFMHKTLRTIVVLNTYVVGMGVKMKNSDKYLHFKTHLIINEKAS